MHVHAIAKSTKSYEHISPELVGNSRRVLVSELSGRSNIAAMVNRPDVKDDRVLLDKVLQEVCRLENEGWQFEAADASFRILVQKILKEHKPFFELEGFRVIVEKRGRNEPCLSEATIKVNINGE